jgi:hypothetical protein
MDDRMMRAVGALPRRQPGGGWSQPARALTGERAPQPSERRAAMRRAAALQQEVTRTWLRELGR